MLLQSPFFMHIGLMIDNIIMNFFTDSKKQITESHQKHFYQKSRMIQLTCTKDTYRILHVKEKNADTKKNYVRIITLKEKN